MSVWQNDRLWDFPTQWTGLYGTGPGLSKTQAASDYSREGGIG